MDMFNLISKFNETDSNNIAIDEQEYPCRWQPSMTDIDERMQAFLEDVSKYMAVERDEDVKSVYAFNMTEADDEIHSEYAFDMNGCDEERARPSKEFKFVFDDDIYSDYAFDPDDDEVWSQYAMNFHECPFESEELCECSCNWTQYVATNKEDDAYADDTTTNKKYETSVDDNKVVKDSDTAASETKVDKTGRGKHYSISEFVEMIEPWLLPLMVVTEILAFMIDRFV